MAAHRSIVPSDLWLIHKVCTLKYRLLVNQLQAIRLSVNLSKRTSIGYVMNNGNLKHIFPLQAILTQAFPKCITFGQSLRLIELFNNKRCLNMYAFSTKTEKQTMSDIHTHCLFSSPARVNWKGFSFIHTKPNPTNSNESNLNF
jgi:hypothetical protein